MREIGFIVAVLISLSGCATAPTLWTRPLRNGETGEARESSFYGDRAACTAMANTTPGPAPVSYPNAAGAGFEALGNQLSYQGARQQTFSDCMMGRGWRQQ
jgi:hypothetical protein